MDPQIYREMEAPPSSGLRAIVLCGLGAGAGFLVSEVLSARFDWSALGLIALLAILLVAVERAVYGAQLIAQTLRLQRQTERDLSRLRDLTAVSSAD
ncbi:hypothetical protein CKO28_10605 [Rhodovibrio sodomensis]|uniref:Uncharacterized protein n=1 Tax=Rhodovibrio sodomensis TaxID=1088 RepID=A0ABS1DDK5_9PROT|nr:hypothetical protein [Rhodovibrio sodomensis]